MESINQKSNHNDNIRAKKGISRKECQLLEQHSLTIEEELKLWVTHAFLFIQLAR